jgi:HlyD family secretion protein
MKKQMIFSAAVSFSVLFFFSCNGEKKKADAYGNFEADEIIVSSEGQGRLLSFSVEEGQQLTVNQAVGLVDTFQLYLKKMQIEASIAALHKKLPDRSQLSVIQQQLDNANREKARIENLVKANAAPSKSLDDINEQIAVLEKQKAALESQLNTQSTGILAESDPLAVQSQQINDQLAKCRIINPAGGTVTVKYAHAGEVVAFGKPLYKIADLGTMLLRAYITGDQLASIKIGQNVTVSIDAGNGTMKKYTGTIQWISDRAEFTPKLIQTKEERVNLVYAMKIKVINDGAIKTGMPAEVTF